jgi:hypothetical protein
MSNAPKDLNQDNPTSLNTAKTLPNENIILILSILSISFSWLYGIPGLAMGMVARSLILNSEELYTAHPDLFLEKSFKMLKIGKICAYSGIILSGIMVILVFLKVVISFIS